MGNVSIFPAGIFKWLENVAKSDMNEVSKDISKGYILEVDLEYPEELHDLNNDYPSDYEKIEIRESGLSNCCREIANKHNISVGRVKRFEEKFGKQKQICFSLPKVNNYIFN